MWPELDMISVASTDTPSSSLETYTLTGVDTGASDEAHRRLVCTTEGTGVLVISEAEGSGGNIEAILGAAAQSGWPIVVRCRTRQAAHTSHGQDRARLVRPDPPVEILPRPHA